ncbi:hypothetical protein GCM10009105_24960 [Dokdonella soli]|uniref:OmpR/PhoB-type domain-containing protein n=2 Tax=Dokdonella soli TaxID=529810 RepID=A0ABP3TXI3_9GAMM
MRLLLHLAARAGEVVSIDELLTRVWSGVIVTPDSVYQAVTSLRRSLGDDPRQPAYIATVPRLGYRMVAAVSRWDDRAPMQARISPSLTGTRRDVPDISLPTLGSSGRSSAVIGAVAALILLLVAGYWVYGNFATGRYAHADASVSVSPQSIGVLPFLDLTTQEMNEEYFADGMTEELIDHMSRILGVRVPGPTSSFYYKGKQLPVADIARNLGVAYLLDGSVRKSAATFRVATRLIRARDGYVVWSETYDRPLGDILTIQKDIAAQMTTSLRASIDGLSSEALPNTAR